MDISVLHYQQLPKAELPVRQVGDATVMSLVGDDSPMDRHVDARLTATYLSEKGSTTVEAPQGNEDLFLYITDGEGTVTYGGETIQLGQYDVILARPTVGDVVIETGSNQNLDYLSFYLPPFLR